MYRSACHLRIGADRVYGLWQPASWSKAEAREAAAEYRSGGAAKDFNSLGEAINGVLRTILPMRTLTSPSVCVSLAGCHVTAAILTFAALPKSAADRRLLISQRFCREHRLEPDSVTVVGCPIRSGKTKEEKILCLAAERGVLDETTRALAGRGLHPDVISPDYLMRFEEANRGELQSPGLALLEQCGSSTILVWDRQGTIMHIARVNSAAPDDESNRRVVARIRRYAQIAAVQDTPTAIYLDGQIASGIIADLLRPAYGLTPLRLPVKARQGSPLYRGKI